MANERLTHNSPNRYGFESIVERMDSIGQAIDQETLAELEFAPLDIALLHNLSAITFLKATTAVGTNGEPEVRITRENALQHLTSRLNIRNESATVVPLTQVDTLENGALMFYVGRNGFTSEPAVMGRKQVVIPAQLEPMVQELNREYRRQREEIAGSNPPQSPAERELGNFKSIFAVLGNWAEFITNAHWMNSVSVTSMGSQVSGGIRMRNDVRASSPVYEELISEFNRLTGRNLAEDMKKGKGKQRASDDLKPFFSLTLPISKENREQVLRLFKEVVLL